MPYYKGMVQFTNFDGRLSHSGDLLDTHFGAANSDVAMEHMLSTRTPFVQRRAVNVQVTQVNLHLAQQLGPHGMYGPGRRRELAPDLGPIPLVPAFSAKEIADLLPSGETVLYRNHQWVVSEAGLYSADRFDPVFIGKDDLDIKVDRDEESLYRWPIDLARHTWIDVYSFCAAFEASFAHHCPDAFDRQLYRNSVYASRTDAAEFALKQKSSAPDDLSSSMEMG